MEREGVTSMKVIFYWHNKRIASYDCNDYGEMIKFLHYCKKYQIEIYPGEFDTSIPDDILEDMGGFGGYIKQYWCEMGSEECFPRIGVEIGV